MKNYQVSEEATVFESSLTIDLGTSNRPLCSLEQTIGDDWTNLLFAWH